jgi:protein-S-isoprenylcysteine O-methyltransferase Ste14
VPPKEREHSPVGAVVLIGLGMLFLLANLGWFSFHWISRSWPLILIVLGLWLFIRRQRGGQ